jgi:hypothetical protein
VSRTSLLWLAAITGLAVIASVAMLASAQVSALGPLSGGQPMFPELAQRRGEPSQLTIETARYRLLLENRGGRWVASAQGDYPVRQDTVAQVFASLASMTTIEPKTSNPALYGHVGLVGPGPGSPSVRVAALGGGTTLLDAVFGRESTAVPYARRGGMFVREADNAQAWLVEGTLTVPGFLQDWFDQLLHIPGTEVARIAILAGDEILVDATKVDFTTGRYQLTFLAEGLAPPEATANENTFRGIPQAIVSTTFDDARPRESVTFATEARTVRFVTRTGLQLDVTLGEAGGETWVAYRASAEPGSEAVAAAQAINARTEHWAFKLPAYRIAALNRPLTDMFELPARAPGPAPFEPQPGQLLPPPLP